MRILHILDHSLPLHSGYTFRTLAILREQRARGWETVHLTSPKHVGARAAEEEVDGWHFYRTLAEPSWQSSVQGLRELHLMKATARRIEEVVRLCRPQVIHAHSPVLNALPALRVGERLGIPVVYEVRAFWEDAAVDHGTSREGGLRYRLTRGLETSALKRAAHVTTICEGLRAELVARGLPEEKITVIPNAVDVEGFKFGEPPDEALRRSLGLEQARVVGFIGSFYAYEGLDLLIEAMPAVLREIGEARVLLVGGGFEEEKLKALTLRLGLEQIVRFVGRVPHRDVQRYYSIVEVLAYPRRAMRLTDLVTPLKPLEAMAQGRLVLASDVGGHRELIHDGVNGALFTAGSAESLARSLIELFRGRPPAAQLKKNGRAFVERERTWRNSVARYAPIYSRLSNGASV